MMVRKPKISVIMAVYNAEKYLDESVQSILNQTFKDFELIIIDDCSTDNSLKIIEKYKKKDDRIVFLHTKKNSGPAATRNIGIKKAKGKYIAILDADDISLPKRIKKQFNFLEKNKDVFLCGTNIKHINEKGKIISTKQLETKWKRIKRKLNSGYNPFVTSSIMFRNKDIYFREKLRYAQDFDLYLRLMTEGHKMVNLEDVLVYLRLHFKSSTAKDSYRQGLFVKKIMEFYQERLNYEEDSYNDFKPESIFNIRNRGIKKKLLERKIILLLKFGEYNKAKHYLKKYKSLDNVSIRNWFPVYICIYFPIIYEIRKKLLGKTK